MFFDNKNDGNNLIRKKGGERDDAVRAVSLHL